MVQRVKLLLAAGADTSAVVTGAGGGQTPLHLVPEVPNIEVARALVQAGADVNARDAAGITVLHRLLHAVEIGSILDPDMGQQELIDMAKLLIANGANLKPRDYDGKAPTGLLDEAMSRGCREILDYLEQEGAAKKPEK